MRKQILYYALKYAGEWHKIAKAIAHQEPWSEVEYAGRYVTIMEDDFPKRLRELEFCPWILFYEGDLSLCKQAGVSIVGSREGDDYGVMMCKKIVNDLKERYVIISGLAKGMDGCAHHSALSHRTIGVVGCGIDQEYPKENASLYRAMRKNHLIISEYPNGVKPLAYHFPWRNRIIAALGTSLIVIQAKIKSGTMLTVNEALKLDIPIYCVPHRYHDIYGSGCNLLISQGANILVEDEDIQNI